MGGSFILLCFYFLSDIRSWKIPILLGIGRNALLLYIMSNLLILALNVMVPVQAPFLNVLLGTGVVVIICLGTGILLDHRKCYIRL
ncbi:MAG TPA: hypothetical protein VHY08_06215 [Bacillota bacterium]|nr:hypothetical protein [Bacillota bacterium]